MIGHIGCAKRILSAARDTIRAQHFRELYTTTRDPTTPWTENIKGSIVVLPLAMKSHARRIVSARKFRRAISRQPRVWFVRNGRDEASSKNKRKSSTRVSIVRVPIFTPTRREDGPLSPRLWYRRSVRYAIPFYGLLCESIPALFGSSRA